MAYLTTNYQEDFPALPEPIKIPLTLMSMIGNKGRKNVTPVTQSQTTQESEFQAECMLCAHLNSHSVIGRSVIGVIDYNHDMDKCHRCPDCFAWDDQRSAEEHSKTCLAFKQKQVTKKPVPKGLPEVPLCKFWDQGHCNFGNLCRNRHSESPLARSAREESGNITCRECGLFGHHQRDCISPCNKCNSEEHTTSKCVRCYRCKEWGHAKWDCHICDECSDAHPTRECPFMRNK